MMHAPYKFLARARGNPDYLVFPLNYPDPEGEFYGYDCQEIEAVAGGTIKGMKELIMVTGVAGSAITALRAGVYTEKKGDMVRLYREHINDEWTTLLAEIYEKCNRQWGYLIPEEEAARQDLRRMCRQALAFENHFLTLLRDFLLAELECRTDSGRGFSLTQATHLLAALSDKLTEAPFTTETGLASEAGEPLFPAETIYQLLAIKALAKMIYPDKKILEALERVRNNSNEVLQQAATETIQTIRSHFSGDILR
jgi:hypothetical protein